MASELELRARRLEGLGRFLRAQDAMLGQIRAELVAGRKESCWMWFVFPQAKGLGHSYRSKLYALSRREARRYLRHPRLGARLCVWTELVLTHMRDGGLTAVEIFGPLDTLKFRSSMDLFVSVATDGQDWALFRAAEQWTYHVPNPSAEIETSGWATDRRRMD